MNPRPPVWTNVEQFDRLLKLRLKFALIDFIKQEVEKIEREVLFTDVSNPEQLEVAVIDEYFQEIAIFNVKKQIITVNDEHIAAAICTLPKEKRNVILLYYFLGLNDVEISKILKAKKGIIGYRRRSGLKILRKILTEQGYENV